ncbi:MGMT family protein [Streptacidiphilus anmyonensis]|uniref:MGMT family protein n=1 Tax=Streptacidiphilus anmyonensis TaxID=405782 RepID=UPI00069396F1|nr:MGMT family protein [Streptacidiphilus anmyonensis]
MIGPDGSVDPGLAALAGDLAGLDEEPPQGFALRVLQAVGISRERYDTYCRLETAAGGLYVAFGPQAVTAAALTGPHPDPAAFEGLHRRRTGRSAIPAAKPFPGLVTAIRTGRARQLPLDLSALPQTDRAVLEAVRTIPAGQLRSADWIARDAGLPAATGAAEVVMHALGANPMAVLIPCHRVTGADGTPFDLPDGPEAGDRLRAAEGIDLRQVAELAREGLFLLGSDTTRIYCHPTCANARRITAAHRVPFRSPREAHHAGYRACRSCRPMTV